MIQPEQVSLPADCLLGEAVVVLYFVDQKPLEGPAAVLDWRLDGQLTRMLVNGEINGKAGEHVMLQSNGKFPADWALFVGGGKWYGLSEETHASLVEHMLSVARKAGFRKLALAFSSHQEFNAEIIVRQVADALATENGDVLKCLVACDVPVTVSADSKL